jgi:hypothetical protein
MPTDEELNQLINMLDSKMSSGSGHINIKVNDSQSLKIEDISVVSKMDCDLGDTACKIPNLPMDDDDQF